MHSVNRTIASNGHIPWSKAERIHVQWELFDVAFIWSMASNQKQALHICTSSGCSNLWVDVTKGPSGRKNTGSGDNPTNMYSEQWLLRNYQYFPPPWLNLGHSFEKPFWFNTRGSLTACTLDFDIKNVGASNSSNPLPVLKPGTNQVSKINLPVWDSSFHRLLVWSPSQLTIQ